MNSQIKKRLEGLEQRLNSDPVVLTMPDGTQRAITTDPMRLVAAAVRGEDRAELAALAAAETISEPGGAHLAELALAVWLSPE